MSAPSKAFNLQSVKIRSTQRLTTSVEPNIARQAVTNVVKPVGGTNQAATQVKVLSPEIYNIVEVDVFHGAEDSTKDGEMVSHHSLYRGLSPWHDLKWKLDELGRSSVFYRKWYAGTSQKRRGLAKGREEVGLTDSTLSAGKLYTWGSGQQRRGEFSTVHTSTQRLDKEKLDKLNLIAKKLSQEKRCNDTSLNHHTNEDDYESCYQLASREKACVNDSILDGKVNAALKSRVWENHKHGSVGVGITMKLFNKFKEEK